MKLPAYPRTKPSGVEWLGDVPEHWSVLPFTKYVSEKSDYRGKTPDKQPDGIFLVTARNVRMGFIDYETSQEFIAEEDYDDVMRRGLPKKGDILFTTEAPLGNVAIVDREDIALAQRVIRFRMSPSAYVSKFALFAMMSDHFQHQLKALSTGSTAEGLKASKLPILRLIAPTLAEQVAIAAFLHGETGRVDRLVAKKRELIERLKEKRTALISRTVTRGLPPAAARAAGLPENPPLKLSALDWLGDIPKHWEVRKFSRCAFFQEGPGLRNWQFTQDGIRVICVTNITEAGISFSNYEKFISEEEYQSTYRHFTVAKGDLLLSSSGNSWGKVATFDADDVAILNTSTIRVNENINRSVIRSLIGWLLISEGTREQLGLFMTGSCQPNFGPSHLARVWICVPPHPEQAAIAAYLDMETAKLDALVGKVEEAIERLQEYRTALITAAVTGKIDVRKPVAP